MKETTTLLIISIIFIWTGMVIGISFLEAPLKFQAPGITTELGLGIGKLVFGALTKAEIGFSLLILIAALLRKDKVSTILLFLIPILIVLIDHVILLPILDARIDLILSGNPPEPSNTHWWYVGLEIIKVITLLYGGLIFVSRNINK